MVIRRVELIVVVVVLAATGLALVLSWPGGGAEGERLVPVVGDLRGMTVEQATAELAERGITEVVLLPKAEPVGSSWTVVEQWPTPEDRFAPGVGPHLNAVLRAVP